MVFDDKGRSLEMKGGSGSGSADTHTYYSQILFRNVYSDSETLTIIPYIDSKDYAEKKNDSNARNDFSKETSLNLNGVTTLQEGKSGDYKITSIEFLNDKTLVHYECSKFLSAMPAYNVGIIDDTGKKYYFKPDMIKEADPITHKYVVQLPVLDKNGQYKLKASDYEKMYEIKEDMKFTINVK